VTPSCLAVEPGGRLGVIPLWQGRVARTAGPRAWVIDQVAAEGFYSMPSAVAVDAGCAFVLSADGRLARYLVP
jgi:hypothetical protein